MFSSECIHCGSNNMEWSRYFYCSSRCKKEAKLYRSASPQRIASLQALVDANGAWRRIDNYVLRVLAKPHRRVVLVEKRLFCVERFTFTCYRITPAGHKLLARWKAEMGVSA